MGDLKDILLQVQLGERKFAPAFPSPEAIAHFQPVARQLKTAFDSGLIENATFTLSKRRDMYNSVVLVVLSGGLTHKGEGYLSSPSRSEPSAFRTWLVMHTSEMIFAIVGSIITAIILTTWRL